MEIVIRNSQRRIQINRLSLERFLRRAVSLLIRKGRDRSAVRAHGVTGEGASPSLEISILLVNDEQMRKLNLAHRGIDKPTDVLSFPQISENVKLGRVTTAKDEKVSKCFLPSDSLLHTSHFLLGDIVINLHQAERQAAERGTTVYEEMRWLLVHGLLHLVGYDHEKDRYQAKKMRAMEREMLQEIKDG